MKDMIIGTFFFSTYPISSRYIDAVITNNNNPQNTTNNAPASQAH